MVSHILNRRALREPADLAEQSKATAPDAEAVAVDTAPIAVPRKKRARAKAPAAPKVKRARAKKAPPRMRARWGVFDAGMKQVAIFDYNQRGAADERLADLLARKKGIHFLQIVKEPMPDPEPVEAPLLIE